MFCAFPESGSIYKLHSELKLVTVDILDFCNFSLCTHTAVVSAPVYSSYNWGYKDY